MISLCVRNVETLLFGLCEHLSEWYQCERIPQIPGYCEKRTTICFASVVVYWSCGLFPPFLSLSLFCLVFGLFRDLFPHLGFSHTCCLSYFCFKQTRTCAVRVTAATSEGSVLSLSLGLWPSRSAAVPAQNTPTESPANRAHHKALVRLFKLPQPLHI